MKIILVLSGILLSLNLFWFFLRSPESYLEKKTKYLIAMSSSEKPSSSDLAMINHISKIAKHIHFDVRLSAEYKREVYIGKSLNEFRSLLASYFKYSKNRNLDYKNLTVRLAENKKKAMVNFDAAFKRTPAEMCKVLIEWIKEKKWYVKKIEVFSCQKL